MSLTRIKRPAALASSVSRQSFTTDAAQDTFTLTGTVSSFLLAEVNGVVQRQGTDFSLSGNDIVFTAAPPAGTLVAYYFELVTITELEAAILSTGAEVAFDKNRIYGSSASPITGNITFDLSSAKAGATAVMVHNQGSAPSFPSAAKQVTGSYTASVDNYIILTYLNDSEILLTITQT